MIVQYEDSEIIVSVNTWTGYPKVCDVTDETFDRMTKLLAFVERSSHHVMPCSAFWFMKDCVEKGTFNCRGGHAFRFWFANQEAANLFHAAYGGELEVPPVLPTRR